MTPVQLAQPETPFMDSVIEALTLTGWKCYHPWRSDNSAKGFPDITAVRGSLLLFIETKGIGKNGRRGTVSQEQQEWLASLTMIPNVVAFAMWPDQWEKIEPYLGRL